MELVELHILQSFPVTCLNRDDVGAPKSAVFGGVQRARVSSQCWKRAIRLHAQQQLPAFGGTRSRYILPALKAALLAQGQPEPAAQCLAAQLAAALSPIDKVEEGNVKTLVYYSPQELANVVARALEQDVQGPLGILLDSPSERAAKDAQSALTAVAKKAVKGLAEQARDAADIAIFGRMVADDHTLTVDGAGMFSHALSTHRAVNEVDFFSAVDDSKPMDRQDAGAGHIGTNEFTSACYYRCMAVNLDRLHEYLSHFTVDEFDAVLATLLSAAVTAVPSARKNSMFGHSLPGYVLGLRRRGQPLSLINAFEAPVRAHQDGYLKPSTEALKAHYQALKQAYGLDAAVETSIPAVGLDRFLGHLVEGKTDPATTAELQAVGTEVPA